jgi:ABC-2 type transport system ATP-binding protein
MFYGSIDIARSMFGIPFDTAKLRPTEFWALQDVNFTLRKGETLGVIGVNGSGKSTLLRLINGIFPPDRGKISITGRMGALIAIGAGFHPHMTGRENIYLNGTIIGMTKREIREKFDAIVDFADIGEFLDAPVATYSSGMNVRLGFSIAVHSDPEILLADEVLAVGDLQFVLKCYRKIAEYRQHGGSVVLVSHGIQLIRNTCSQVIWLDRSWVKEYGETQSVCDHYEDFIMQKDASGQTGLGTRLNYDPEARITGVEFLRDGGRVCEDFRVGDAFKARIHFDCHRKVRKPKFTIGILNPENIAVMAHYSHYDGGEFAEISGTGYVDFAVQNLPLKPGTYTCTVTLAEDQLSNVLDWHEKSYRFMVRGNPCQGILNLPAEWTLHQP